MLAHILVRRSCRQRMVLHVGLRLLLKWYRDCSRIMLTRVILSLWCKSSFCYVDVTVKTWKTVEKTYMNPTPNMRPAAIFFRIGRLSFRISYSGKPSIRKSIMIPSAESVKAMLVGSIHLPCSPSHRFQ
jgi:hypothetical protein